MERLNTKKEIYKERLDGDENDLTKSKKKVKMLVN